LTQNGFNLPGDIAFYHRLGEKFPDTDGLRLFGIYLGAMPVS
jgi:hypothetical protein